MMKAPPPTPFADFCSIVDDIATTQRALDWAAMNRDVDIDDLESLREAARAARIRVKSIYSDALNQLEKVGVARPT